jgi:hypothetical protein
MNLAVLVHLRQMAIDRGAGDAELSCDLGDGVPPFPVLPHHQLQNLLATEPGRTQYADEVKRLDARLQQLKACTGASCRS